MDTTRPDHWLQTITARGSKRSYGAGEIIAGQDELPDFVGYILSGRAKAVSFSENGAATWVGHFEQGAFFGHASLLSGAPVNFEICADNDMEAIFISTAAMRDILSEDSDLTQVLAQDLAARLSDMSRRLVDAFTLSAKGRVCAELARLSDVIGIMPEKTIIRPVPIFVDLALRINSTRETVSRTVSHLERKGIIARSPGALVIQDPDGLRSAIV